MHRRGGGVSPQWRPRIIRTNADPPGARAPRADRPLYGASGVGRVRPHRSRARSVEDDPRSTTSPRGSEAGRNSAATSGKPWPIAQLPCLASRTFRAECRLVHRSRRRFRARSEPILPGCRHDRPGLEHGAKNLERDRSPGAGHLAGTCRPPARSPPSGECRLGRRVTDSSRRFVSPRLTLTRNGNFSITQPPTNREVNSTC